MFSISFKEKISFKSNNSENSVYLKNSYLNEIEEILIEICSILETKQNFQFTISGFGDIEWKMDIARDLASIIGELPKIIVDLKNNNYPVEIYFYEQGLDRRLTCEYNSFSSIKLTCDSGTSWMPKSRMISLEKEAFLSQLINLQDDFVEYAEQVSPHLTSTQQFIEWRKYI